MHPLIFRIACLLLALGVALGAFGAHGLEGLLTADQLDSYHTAVRYQFYHGLALLILSVTWNHLRPVAANWAARLLIGGIVLFCGSLYLLSTGHLLGISNWRWLGPVTPLGGLAFMAAWLLMAGSVLAKRNDSITSK